jgi:hypothetical protein
MLGADLFSLLLHTPISTLTAQCLFYGCFFFLFSRADLSITT